MSQSPRSDDQRRISPIGPTLDAPPGHEAPTPSDRGSRQSSALRLSDASSGTGDRCRVELVEGSGPEMTQETQCLLRRRLRLAAALLAIGFTLFWLKSIFVLDISEPVRLRMFIAHGTTALVLATVAGLLWRSYQIPLRRLRGLELITFGLPALFFLAVQYVMVLQCCQGGHFDFPIALWLLMIYTYALFIPNTLRRAIVIIALMTMLPIAGLGLQLWFYPEVAAQANIEDVSSVMLVLILAAVSGVFGVDTIGSLRRQAFEARQLGHYRLKQPIGAGGMGEVYLAEHNLLKRPCVIKLIRPEKAGDPRALARFQREVRATARLTHWNTIEIFDYGNTSDGTFYYVMEYLPGMSLAEIVEQHGRMPPERVVHLLRQACDGLREAHQMGLIHRDIKPGNIFAAQRGGVYDVAKLLDFGLVKPIVESFEEDEADAMQLTTEGAITGSPLFMSPEQAVGDHAPDRRSDIYSLGAVAYFMLTGRPPFEGSKPLRVMIAHAREPVVPPSELGVDVPADLERVIVRCLAKDPADRYQDVTELAEALDQCECAGRWDQQVASLWWRQSGEVREPSVVH